MEVDLYDPSLPPRLRGDLSMHESDLRHVSDQHSDRMVSARPKKHADKRKHKVRARYVSQSSSSEEDQSSVPRQRSSKLSRAPSDQDQPQHNPDPLFYREVAMADLPSQYAEEVETFRHILDLSDPRETIPRSSISLLRDLGTINGTQTFFKHSFCSITSKSKKN